MLTCVQEPRSIPSLSRVLERNGDCNMTAEELIRRNSRIYAAIGALQESDLSQLPGRVFQNDRVTALFQDFSGNLKQEDIENAAHTVIHNIANLQDHLRRWAHHNRKDKTKVDEAFDASLDLRIMKDLSNNDKHGYPPRDGGHSGLSPVLKDVRRVMQLRTGATPGSSVTMTFGPGGVPKVSGSGTAQAIITGEVVDKDQNLVGDLFEIQDRAVRAWEGLIENLGVFDKVGSGS